MKAALASGDYQARSVIASAQRCVNLYPEKNAEDAPFPVTHYPTPGLKTLVGNATVGGSRCSYTASNGDFYEVIGPNVYYTNRLWTRMLLGKIGNATTPVSMADNGLVILIVDGSPNGYGIDMVTRQFAPVSGQNGAFFGADRVDVVDTFFVLNVPGTNLWYISLSEVDLSNLMGTVSPDQTAAAFDPLDIAAKSGYPDAIQGVIVMHREPWLVGTQTSEVWYDAGNADFTFGILPGVFIEHGAVAKYSLAKQDLSVFWLSQDKQGQAIVLMGNQYAAKRVSTHAIEQQIQGYATVSDAIGFTYQQLGHTFYVLTFPTADATWVYDVAEDLWHERVWIDTNGIEHRHRANNAANAYGINVVGDWQTGALYQWDLETFTDFGGPIVRRRGFPIMRQDSRRVEYTRLVLDVDVGEVAATAWNTPGGLDELLDSDFQPILDSNNSPILTDATVPTGSLAYPVPFGPKISLRYSDDRGKNWGNPIVKDMGATGIFNRSVLFTRMGIGRNRVFEAFWDGPYFTAINGGDVFYEPLET